MTPNILGELIQTNELPPIMDEDSTSMTPLYTTIQQSTKNADMLYSQVTYALSPLLPIELIGIFAIPKFVRETLNPEL